MSENNDRALGILKEIHMPNIPWSLSELISYWKSNIDLSVLWNVILISYDKHHRGHLQFTDNDGISRSPIYRELLHTWCLMVIALDTANL